MTSFRPYEPDQQLLLPPSLRDWLPSDHLVWFISETVDQLDVGEIIDGLGFRQFSVRGLRKVAGEFNLVCMAMNLRQMANMIRWEARSSTKASSRGGGARLRRWRHPHNPHDPPRLPTVTVFTRN